MRPKKNIIGPQMGDGTIEAEKPKVTFGEAVHQLANIVLPGDPGYVEKPEPVTAPTPKPRRKTKTSEDN